MIEQGIQLVGADLVLGAFAALQLGRVRIDDLRYLTLNVLGSGILLILAILDREWGFILLEGVWVAVSLIGIVRVISRPKSPSHYLF